MLLKLLRLIIELYLSTDLWDERLSERTHILYPGLDGRDLQSAWTHILLMHRMITKNKIEKLNLKKVVMILNLHFWQCTPGSF